MSSVQDSIFINRNIFLAVSFRDKYAVIFYKFKLSVEFEKETIFITKRGVDHIESSTLFFISCRSHNPYFFLVHIQTNNVIFVPLLGKVIFLIEVLLRFQ